MLPSWERRDSLGAFKALFLTLKEVFFQPVRTFSHMPISGGIGGPLLFAVIVYTIRVGGFFLVEVSDDFIDGDILRNPKNLFLNLCGAMVAPALACVVILGTAGIFHTVAILAGATRNGFEGTLRVICYAWVPASISVFPFACVETNTVVWDPGVALKLVVFAVIGTIAFRKALRANYLQIRLFQFVALLWLGAVTLRLGMDYNLDYLRPTDNRSVLLEILYWLTS